MFSLYGVSGRLFRGSMEHLRHIGPIGSVARTHGVEAVGRDLHDGVFLPEPEMDSSAHGRAELMGAAAVASYAQTQRNLSRRQLLTRVDALMSTSVITVLIDASVEHAWQLLMSHGVGQAPVLDHSASLVGLVTRAGLLPAPGPGTSWAQHLAGSVRSVMTSPVPAVAPDTDVRRLAQVLLDAKLPGLPVVDDDGQLVGFVSRSDILRALTTEPPLDLWG